MRTRVMTHDLLAALYNVCSRVLEARTVAMCWNARDWNLQQIGALDLVEHKSQQPNGSCSNIFE